MGASVCMCVRESASAIVVQLCTRLVVVCVCGSVRVCVRECLYALSECVCVLGDPAATGAGFVC